MREDATPVASRELMTSFAHLIAKKVLRFSTVSIRESGLPIAL